MGGGEDQFYEKKLSKEEKKALAQKKREEKRAKKNKGKQEEDGDDDDDVVQKALENALKKGEVGENGLETNEAAEQLASEGTICTFSTSRKGVDARSRDVNVQNFTLQHKGTVMLDGTSVVLNHGNRYGLIGRNGKISLCHAMMQVALCCNRVLLPISTDLMHQTLFTLDRMRKINPNESPRSASNSHPLRY